ncbi:MAG: gamma-glutamylcyclotransferase [Candidatus Bathyarchaeota archaeon]|nr:MAG: gamma-glutamylcyclotransferase [Candidatus Bathyarchaeota archaeon]
MYHYGYGSNLSSRFLRGLCPSARFVMKADLPNFKVEFRFYSEIRQGGISSIIERPSEMVRGVIYEVPEEEMLKLDVIESVPQGLYKRETFVVLGEDGQWHEAELYRVVKPQGPFTPARSYIELMVEGAEEHDLDPDYIEELKRLLSSLN